MSKSRTVLVADGTSDQLFRFLHAATDAGFSVLLAESAANCVSLCAQYKPDAVILDESMLTIDQWSIPELLNLVSAKSVVILSAEKPAEWNVKTPQFVRVVVKRSDPSNIISVLQEMFRS